MNDYMCNEVRKTVTTSQLSYKQRHGQPVAKNSPTISVCNYIWKTTISLGFYHQYMKWIWPTLNQFLLIELIHALRRETGKGLVTCVYGTDNILQIVWNKQPVNTFNGRTRMRFCKVSYSWVPLTGTQDEFCIIV